MESPISRQRLPTAKETHGLDCIRPNRLPDRAAIAPNPLYVKDMPVT
jgi:hypothetical protein